MPFVGSPSGWGASIAERPNEQATEERAARPLSPLLRSTIDRMGDGWMSTARMAARMD